MNLKRSNNRLLKTHLMAVTIGILSVQASAQIYKTTLPDGSVVYSDSASDNAKKIELEPVNQVPAIKLPKKQQAPITEAPTTEEEPIVYRYIKVSSPNNDQAIEGLAGNASISLVTKPALAPADSIRLYLNGKTYKTAQQTHFSLTELPHGSHRVSASIINKAGKVVKSSKSIEFHIFRHNVSQQRRGR